MKGVIIPRLELCAASILKKLYVETSSQLECAIDKVYLWSDSTIVLCWLQKAPHLLRPFESNRVEDTQTVQHQVSWRHVRSEDNPADALSRGQLPADFLENSLWTSGPAWLALDQSQWPQSFEPPLRDVPGFKKTFCLVTDVAPEPIYSRFSNFPRFTRVVVYLMRWKTIRTFRNRPISVEELRIAEDHIFQLIQRERCAIEIRKLSTNSSSNRILSPFTKGTPFDQLHPFIDDAGMGVTGRIFID